MQIPGPPIIRDSGRPEDHPAIFAPIYNRLPEFRNSPTNSGRPPGPALHTITPGTDPSAPGMERQEGQRPGRRTAGSFPAVVSCLRRPVKGGDQAGRQQPGPATTRQPDKRRRRDGTTDGQRTGKEKESEGITKGRRTNGRTDKDQETSPAKIDKQIVQRT